MRIWYDGEHETVPDNGNGFTCKWKQRTDVYPKVIILNIHCFKSAYLCCVVYFSHFFWEGKRAPQMDSQIVQLCKKFCRIFEWSAAKERMGGKRDRGKKI